jgi:alkylation response protein AidB-like acyl-CoA dehydrogenase
MTADLWERRDLFDGEHETFRASVREFLARHVVDNIENWDKQGDVPREVWLAAGEQGFIGLNVPEQYGGGGTEDYRFRVAMIEEFARASATSLAAGFAAQTDIVLPYVFDFATPQQGKRWLPKLATGEYIGAIAMTEPGTGSDLQGITTTAKRAGGEWVLNGAKTFITNGIHADLVVVVARTATDPTAGSTAFSLFVVEEGMAGFSRGRKLDKVGLRSQDTAELFFDDVRLSDDHLLGDEGRGLPALMSHLPLERLSIAVTACAGARAALSWTVDYVTERKVFGQPIAQFQNTQFAVAEMVTELDVTQAYVDNAVLKLNRGALDPVDAAKAKWWATEMHKRVVDRCLQFFGGYGYMLEYPIARAYADTRITTIFGGTTEIMKVLIARSVLRVR